MSSDRPRPEHPHEDLPEPVIDPAPARAPGGPDAIVFETPDASAQTRDLPRPAHLGVAVPTEIDEPEASDQATGTSKDRPAGTEPPV